MKKNTLVIALLFSLVQTARGQYADEAKELIENERFSSAETLLEQKIANYPDPEMSYLLVKTYLEQDKTNEARIFVDQHLQPVLNSDAGPFARIAAAPYYLNTGNKRAAGGIFPENGEISKYIEILRKWISENKKE